METTDFSKGAMWAMAAERFDVLQRRFYEMKASGDISSLVLKFEQENEEGKLYEMAGSVAVIPISGPITKRSSFYSWFFGGSSVQNIEKAIKAAIDDPDVASVLFDVDSPGGTVNGIDALSKTIYELKEKKPVVAYANGMMASAAYWLGSSADAVVTDATADLGSIGVLMVHTDWSEFDKRVGIKTTYLTTGKYKALGNDAEPLSDLARETFQKELDYICGIFIDAVARNREISAEEVRENMADGRIFIGRQAVDAGLADSVGTFESALVMVDFMQKYIKQTGGKSPKGANNVR